jgi:hypothetical protein
MHNAVGRFRTPPIEFLRTTVLPTCRGGAMKLSGERMPQRNAKNPFGFSSPCARVD